MHRPLPVIPSSSPALPPRYDAWLREALGASLPHEPTAPCDPCVMLGDDDPVAHAFDPVTRCCTHTPALPNFLIGSALAVPPRDPAEAHGQATLRARLRDRSLATPLGVTVAPAHRAREDEAAAAGRFGQVRSLRCPHHVDPGGLCGIHATRSATCATWFCKHARGVRGHQLWRAVEGLLRHLEGTLARHCLEALALPPAALAALLARPEDAPPGDRHALAWGPWLDREEDFYRRCAAVVDGLSWPEVLRLGGPEAGLRLRVLHHAVARLEDPTLPPRVRAVSHDAQVAVPGHVLVATYSKLDPVALPESLARALAVFDGGTITEARRRLAAEHRLAVDDDVLRTLLDFGILTEEG
jgi:hypothetical protein